MYKKILVPLDGSERSIKALDHAISLAEKFSAKITLVNVIPILPPYTDTTIDRLGHVQQSIIDELLKSGHDLLDQYVSSFSDKNIEMDQHIIIGNPAKEILDKAKLEDYDLIVIGSRGLGEIKGYIMGSVSNRVSRHATCPVLIIH